MFSHPLARELELWWRENGAKPGSAGWERYLVEFESLMQTKLQELAEEHTNTGGDGERRFGMSGAGSCTRKAGLKWLGFKGEPFTGSTLMTFHVGHLLECAAVATMRAAGYEVGGTQEPVRIDPFMHSYSDGIVRDIGRGGEGPPLPCVLSVKTTGYKMSGLKRGGRKGNPRDYNRYGFAGLPFDGVRKANPSWWVQAQAEMHGSGIEHCLILVVAKDIIKLFEHDPYMMGEGGNGSLTFYAEMIEYDPVFCQRELLPIWGQEWDSVTDGHAGTAFVFNPEVSRFVRLPQPGDNSDQQGWGGPNKEASGSFNHCYGCEMADACTKQLAREYRR